MLQSRPQDRALAQADHPFYGRVDELLLTRGQVVVARLGCERILLPRAEGWPTHHVHGHLGRTDDGALHAVVAGGSAAMLWHSPDGGICWQGSDLGIEAVGAFAVLGDDAFLLACGGGRQPIRLLRSMDRGASWVPLSEIGPGAFDALHLDGNLLPLRDGTVLLAASLRLDPPAGQPPGAGHYPQYLFRSTDGGATWSGGGDPAFWEGVRRGDRQVGDDGPPFTWPGEGGTFSGVYETGFLERRDGRVMGAFRLSGYPRPWHRELIAAWGEPPEAPDAHGRLFRHVVLGESADGGRTWQNLRPVLDAAGQPLMAHGECNGELVELG
ncbi:MAG: sialidase family protein, partial [Gemmatimonadota bacterium]